MNPTPGVPCPPELLAGFARLLDAQPETAVLMPSATNAVWLFPDRQVVLRVAGLEQSVADLDHLGWLTGLLADAGVPVVNPARQCPVLTCQGRAATVWQALTPTPPLDWHAFGAATRSLHDVGAAAVRTAAVHGNAAAAARVPAVLDVAELSAQLDRLRPSGLVPPRRLAALERRLTWLLAAVAQADLDALAGTGAAADPRAVLVHDDLWSKNAIPVRCALAGSGLSHPGVVLADCDSLAWGPRGYDLAFVARDVAAGKVSPADGAAFEAGYGQELPGRGATRMFALAHQLRRVLLMESRLAWMPARAEQLLAGDLAALDAM